MNDDIRRQIHLLRHSASKQRALNELARYDSKDVVGQLLDLLHWRNVPELEECILGLLAGLESSDIDQRVMSAAQLLNVGHSYCVFLGQWSARVPLCQLAVKIRGEIDRIDAALSQAVEMTQSKPVNRKTETAALRLSELMIAATSTAVPLDSLSVNALNQAIEINVDAWSRARVEIVGFGSEGVRFLEAALSDADVNVRRVAARMLTILGNANSIATFVNAVRDTDPVVRDEAALGLSNLRSDTVMAHITDLATSLGPSD